MVEKNGNRKEGRSARGSGRRTALLLPLLMIFAPGDISFSDPTALTTTFRVPGDAATGQTIHVILKATDNGAPSLTRYQRVIVRVQ